MSIIHEALKKVQSNRLATKSATAPVVRPESAKKENDSTYFTKPLAVRDNQIPSSAQKKAPVKKTIGIKGDVVLWSFIFIAFIGYTVFNLYQFSLQTDETDKISASVSQFQPSQSPQLVSPAILANAKAHLTEASAKGGSASGGKGSLVLTGIMSMDGKNVALINEAIFETGDEVNGAKITSIMPDHVIIEQKGKTKTLKITTQGR